jgi:predicted 2-oxoglutarate/Fe(II)-dependent dioxygenase YbiX
MLELDERIKIIPNVLTREQCAEIIANAKDYEQDFLKRDIAEQSRYFDKETLDKNTIEKSLEDTIGYRKVQQAPIDNPIFPVWDDKPVYRMKVMKYETGDYLRDHKDAGWMCISNYWKPNTNMVSQSLISIALNDDFEGGEFRVEKKIIPQPVGTAVQIPQFGIGRWDSLSHGVSEVTKGTRYALVFWNFA